MVDNQSLDYLLQLYSWCILHHLFLKVQKKISHHLPHDFQVIVLLLQRNRTPVVFIFLTHINLLPQASLHKNMKNHKPYVPVFSSNGVYNLCVHITLFHSEMTRALLYSEL